MNARTRTVAAATRAETHPAASSAAAPTVSPRFDVTTSQVRSELYHVQIVYM